MALLITLESARLSDNHHILLQCIAIELQSIISINFNFYCIKILVLTLNAYEL